MTDSLRVAIVHYHLNPGGVTRVMDNAVTALRSKGSQAVLLVGDVPSDGTYSLERVRIIEELAYNSTPGAFSTTDLVERLKKAAASVLKGPPDIWHFHNHCLGKNIVLPGIVCELARQGESVLLQIHDFAEDGRPANYRFLLKELGDGDSAELGENLYPIAPHVHYAALNGRDRRFLLNAGVPADCLHLLPNAVWVQKHEMIGEEKQEAERLFLYPTRAIRRKNLGEFILWSALDDQGDRYATTLAPENPVERVFYEQWVKAAQELELPIDFAIGSSSRAHFSELLRKSHALVTTSVAEGFGLAFLEPWLVGRAVLGRNLPEITVEFTEAGVDLSNLYTKLEVPLEWVGQENLNAHVRSALQPFLESYGRTMETADVEQAVASMITDGHVDFGRLDEELQETAVRKAAGFPDARAQIRPQSLLPDGDFAESIEKNRSVIEKEFSLDRYGDRLLQIYTSILNSRTADPSGLSVEKLLSQFLSPERFTLIRT